MNKIAILIGFLLLTGSLSAWSIPSNYQSAVNLSVNNWHYVATYGSNAIQEAPTPYILVNVIAGSNPFNYLIKGYSVSGVDLGKISYSVVNFVGQNAFIVIYNRTDIGTAWQKASIFYNPIGDTISGSICNGNTNVFANSFKFNCPAIVQNTYPYAINGIAQYFNTTIATNFPIFAVPFNKTNAIVVLANRSLVYEKFNITFSPDPIHTFSISANNLQTYYTLSDLGILGQSVTQQPTNSLNAENLFGNANYDFEAYLGSPSYSATNTFDQLLSMQTRANTENGLISNIVSSASISLIPSFQRGTLNLQILTANKIRFVVIPAFTTNYILSNVITNSQATSSQVKDFQNYYQVTNVNWNYQYTTFADPYSLGVANTIFIGANNVPFIRLTLPNHLGSYGLNCENLYLNTSNLGSIPFYVLNCGSQPTLIIQNTTSNGNTFNSFKIYFNSVNGFNFGFSKISVFNSWLIASGTTINGIATTNYGSLLINVSPALNANSLLTLDYGQNAYVGYGKAQANNAQKITDYVNNPISNFLFTYKDISGNKPEIFGNTISLVSDTFAHFIASNSFASVNGASGSLIGLNIIISTPLIANLTQLTTTNYIFNPVPFGVNTTSSLPSSTGHLLFPTTTINFKALNSSVQLFPLSITMPLWTISIVLIIIFLLGAFLLTHGEELIGFGLILIVMWIIGLSNFLANGNFTLIAVAVIITLIIGVFEYTKEHKKVIT